MNARVNEKWIFELLIRESELDQTTYYPTRQTNESSGLSFAHTVASPGTS